jgi:proteasome lid subunit RPN8/RPN11
MVILDSITHTARRQHQCACCGLTVHTGERYVRAQVPGGGRAAKRAFHSKCYVRLTAAAEKGGR